MRGAAILIGFAIAPSNTVLAETITVLAKDLGFVPPVIEARVGDRVRWVNEDVLLHSATTSSWNVEMLPNATASRVMVKAGMIEYRCRYHPGMTGKIVVKIR